MSQKVVDTHVALTSQSDASILRLLQSFLESAPTLVLQLYIIMSTQTWGWFTGECMSMIFLYVYIKDLGLSVCTGVYILLICIFTHTEDFIIVLICSSLHDDKIDLHDSESTFEPLQLLIVD